MIGRECRPSELRVDGDPLPDTWEDIGPQARLYYRSHEPHQGFNWVSIEWCSGSGTWPGDKPLLNDPDCTVELIAHGVAYWDGLRHWHWGKGGDEAGYLYYASPALLVKMIGMLVALEGRFCSQHADDP